MKRGVDAVLLAHLFWSENLKLLVAIFRAEHADVFTHELAVVLVGGHHKSLQSIDGFSLFCEGANHVVGFESADFKDWDVVSLKDALDVRHSSAYSFWSLFALSLVRFKRFVAESWSGRVEGHAYMCRFLLVENIFQSIDKSEYRRCVQTLRIYAWSFDESVVGTVD